MTIPDTNEQLRLASLYALKILDTPPEARFDRFTLLASAAFGAPIAMVSLIDAERQWLKSCHGVDAAEIARSMTFCTQAIEGRDTFVVTDAARDPRFAANPSVAGAPHVRFYAGHPVRSLDGYAVGTLCIVDTRPRSFSADERAMLAALAQMVEDELNKDMLVAARTRAEVALHQLNLDLEQRVFERTAALEAKNGELQREIERRAAVEATLRHSEERLATITNNLPVLISYIDSDMRYQFANAMYHDWLGVPAAAMLGQSVEAAFGADYFEERRPWLERAMAGEMCTTEYTIARKRHRRILSTTYIPHLRDGKVVGAYVLGTDATAAREHERQLLALANSDPLTGLPNRRMYEFQLDKALAAARRQRGQLALLYLDLDNFKKINDTLGHAVGDTVLVEFGRRVKAVLRETDMLARLAGDEFTVILESNVGMEAGELVAHKILQALATPFVTGAHRIQIAASIGVALGGHRSSPASLAASADAALYAAKRSGKNRFALLACSSEPPLTHRIASRPLPDAIAHAG